MEHRRRWVWAAMASAVLASGCAIEKTHGYVPTEGDLSQIEVGLDTQETVASIVGRPGTTGFLDEDGWYYVKSDLRRVGPQDFNETRREVVAILFSEEGTVANIERFGLDQGEVITLSRRVSDTSTTGIGFIQQLVGNLGNFNPAGAFGGGG